MDNSADDKEKYLLVLKTLYEERKVYMNFVIRKEVAAWAAIVVFIAIIAFSLNLIKFDMLFYKIFFSSFIISLGFIFFAFIHTQYSSIHASYAIVHSLMTIFTSLLRKKSYNFSEIEINKELGTPKCINDIIQKTIKKNLPYRGQKHPIKIMWDFFPLRRWASSNMEKRKNIHDAVTQEAALNWLLLLTIIFPLVYIWSDYLK